MFIPEQSMCKVRMHRDGSKVGMTNQLGEITRTAESPVIPHGAIDRLSPYVVYYATPTLS